MELAVERLYREATDMAEAERWTAAAADPAFRDEMRTIASDLDEPDGWPR